MVKDSGWKQMAKATVPSGTEEQKMGTLSGIEVGGMAEKGLMRFHAWTIVDRSSSFSDLTFPSGVVRGCPAELSMMAE